MTATTKKMFRGFSLMTAFTLLYVVFITPACTKNEDCKATVTVVDTAGGGSAPVAGASVRLWFSSGNGNQLEQTAVTDGSGKASFTFKLEATWDITATASTGEVGTGIITLKPNETAEKTVML